MDNEEKVVVSPDTSSTPTMPQTDPAPVPPIKKRRNYAPCLTRLANAAPTAPALTAAPPRKKIKDMDQTELRAYNAEKARRFREKHEVKTADKAGNAAPVPSDTPIPLKQKKTYRPTFTAIPLPPVPPGEENLTGKRRAELVAMRLNAEQKAKRLAQKAVAQFVYDTPGEIDESEARQILEQRGIKHGHVLDTVYNLAIIASDSLGLLKNRFYFQHGVQAVLESQVAKTSRPLSDTELPDVWYPGERIRLRDLHALWDYGMSWREQPDGRLIEFNEFRRLRRMCMTDTFEFGRQILGKDFHSEPHGRWANELFVKKNPDLLPETYSQEDLKKALVGQSNIHQRLLISSRNSYKSTYNLIDLLSWVLVFGGDIRIFMISATKKLSQGFLKSFRDYWTLKNPKDPNLFNQLFTEFMIEPGEGAQNSFISPMRQLDLIQPTLTSASMGSEGLAGERSDIICAEDCAEISNSNSPEMREKTLEFFDSVLHLLEPTGYLQVVGTPFAPGDIYDVLFEREEKRDEKLMLHQINPTWTLKPGVNKLPYDVTLTEDEVDLLFPSRLTFKWLKNKLRDGEKEFRQQYLCSWVPDADSELKITFDLVDLELHAKTLAYFNDCQTIETILSIDLSFSTGNAADYSALATIRFAKMQSKPVAIVEECLLQRLRYSELATKIIETIQRNRFNRIIIEKSGAWESLQAAITKGAFLRGMSLPPFYWKPTTTGGILQAQAKRIKGLEPRLANGELWFVKKPGIDPALDAIFIQFTKFDGGPFKKSNATRKMDAPDAIAIGLEYAFPRHEGDIEKTAEQIEQERLAREAVISRQNYQRIFGGETRQPQLEQPEDEPRNYFAGLKRRS